MKIVVIIQARLSSTRLPGKVLMKLCDKSVLEHVVLRVKQSRLISDIIIATTTNPIDDKIVAEAKRLGLKCFRGSENDVLSRFYLTAAENNVDAVIRITSDCPLVDPNIIDNMVKIFADNKATIVSNATADPLYRTFPRGLDTEVFTFESLKEANERATAVYQREHVTPYIYEHASNIKYYLNEIDYSNYRLTLDTEEDYELISNIYKELYKGTHDFYLDEIVNLLERNTDLVKINSGVKQKKVNENE